MLPEAIELRLEFRPLLVREDDGCVDIRHRLRRDDLRAPLAEPAKLLPEFEASPSLVIMVPCAPIARLNQVPEIAYRPASHSTFSSLSSGFTSRKSKVVIHPSGLRSRAFGRFTAKELLSLL